MCFELNVKNVTSFLSNKWMFEQINTDLYCVVVLGQNTVRINVNIVWVVSMILTKCLAIITKIYSEEDVSIPFAGKSKWFVIYAIRMKLNKYWERWRKFKVKKRVSARILKYRQESPQKSRNMKRLHKVTLYLFGRGPVWMRLPCATDLMLFKFDWDGVLKFLLKITDVFNSAHQNKSIEWISL